MMKATILVSVTLFMVSAFAEAIVPLAVKTLNFETVGPDCYADGSPVLAGECYALVWRKTGTTSQGLPIIPPNPNLPAVDGLWVAEYFPVAYNDKGVSNCPKVSIGGLSVSDENNGTWTVFLLDTRYELDDGSVVCGFDPSETNVPRRINAYRPIEGLIDFKIGTCPASPTGQPPAVGKMGGDLTNFDPMIADLPSVALPEPVPLIRSFSLGNGWATISVANTATYLQYDLFQAEALSGPKSGFVKVGSVQWGQGDDILTWSLPVDSHPQLFFKVFCRPLVAK